MDRIEIDPELDWWEIQCWYRPVLPDRYAMKKDWGPVAYDHHTYDAHVQEYPATIIRTVDGSPPRRLLHLDDAIILASRFRKRAAPLHIWRLMSEDYEMSIPLEFLDGAT